MFVGHLALGLAAKRAEPRLSLGWLMAAATMLDLVWPILVLAGIETVRIVPGATAFNPLVFDSYPWSHSLLMAIGWGILLAAVIRVVSGSSPMLLLIALVVSHWVLDVITHAPDMPLWPGKSSLLGLGLWRSIPATYIVEGGLWIAGITVYLTGMQPTRRAGPIALWSLILLCTVMWASSPWGPPPPSPRALGWAALSGWLIPFWAAAADRYYRS